MRSTLINLPTGTSRSTPLARAVEARRALHRQRPRGRAWINGREVGGPDARYRHLAASYD